jgi:hypothetical protein
MINAQEISDFLSNSSNFVTTAEGALQAGKHLWTAVNTLRAHQAPPVNPASERLRKALRVDLNSSTSFRLSDSHPTLVPNQAPSADLKAFIALVGSEFVEAIGDPATYSELDAGADIEEDLVLFGSPESETFTRHLFGYQYSSQGDKVVHLDRLPLPFRWDEDPTSVVVRCLHYRAGGAVAVRPNWPLVHCKQDRRIFPLLNEGFLAEDYLLITRIPNYATVRAHQSGRAILSISGLHGIGTSAIGLVLGSSDIANQIAEMAEHNIWFQAVIKVTSIGHDEVNGSRPESIQMNHLVGLEISDAALEAARQSLVDEISRGQSQPRGRNHGFGLEISKPFTPEKYGLIDAVRKHGSVFEAMVKRNLEERPPDSDPDSGTNRTDDIHRQVETDRD